MDRFTTLQLFVRVVETGSFSKAANDLGLTQPTVTKHVSTIEHRLGVRLLNRNSRGISLTEIGSLYFERCKVVLRELEAAESIIGQQRGEIKGTLRIGTSMTFGQQVIGPLLIDFLLQHPKLKVDLSCDDRYVDVVGQGLDIAIRLGELADSVLGCRYLGINPWVMVASDAYLSAHGAPTHPNELSRHQCLIYSTVQGDDIWHVRTPNADQVVARVSGKLKTNNLSILLGAVQAGSPSLFCPAMRRPRRSIPRRCGASWRTTCCRSRRVRFSRQRCLLSRRTCSNALRASGGRVPSLASLAPPRWAILMMHSWPE